MPARVVATTAIPLFLAPAFADLRLSSPNAIRPFSLSTSRCLSKKNAGKRDMNRRRGESVIRSTGTRRKLFSENKYPKLPTPRPENERPLDDFPVNPTHGLYGFFNKERDTVLPGEKEDMHGRAWDYKELVFKDFRDLHALYWACVKELNIVRTRMIEFQRLKLGYGEAEIEDRFETVRETMNTIRKVLYDRQSAYEEAKLLREQQTLRELFQEPQTPLFDEPQEPPATSKQPSAR